ncbi:methionine ABC transporter ATP-binding protein [Bacillus australimaris]|uniref:methionine ABC transporter ATP-binding protein n=1 Tax=Bacillus australimaris TaxID=1326968 RepID=UPI0039B36C84
MIEFKDVQKVYQSGQQNIEALSNINLTIEKGDIFGVVGYSGAGKSTLLRLVNLLERPTAGEVKVNGKILTSLSKANLRKEKKDIGMIFQHFHLLQSKTVFDNVALPLLLSGSSKRKIKERVDELLSFVGLESKANNYPEQLSGGQKQRVGIARALATNPSILLCDEATSALDPDTTSAILDLLKKINQAYDITILLITHEMSVIRDICTKVAVMENGQIVEKGSVYEIFSHPKTEIARRFVRTVIHEHLPNSIIEELKNGQKTVWKMNFIGHSSSKPLLSTIAKKYDIDVNVLSANISEIQDTPFGNMIVEVTGEQTEIEKAFSYIQQEKINVQEVAGLD